MPFAENEFKFKSARLIITIGENKTVTAVLLDGSVCPNAFDRATLNCEPMQIDPASLGFTPAQLANIEVEVKKNAVKRLNTAPPKQDLISI